MVDSLRAVSAEWAGAARTSAVWATRRARGGRRAVRARGSADLFVNLTPLRCQYSKMDLPLNLKTPFFFLTIKNTLNFLTIMSNNTLSHVFIIVLFDHHITSDYISAIKGR